MENAKISLISKNPLKNVCVCAKTVPVVSNVEVVSPPRDAVNLLGEHRVEDGAEEVVGVSEEEEEDGDDERRLKNVPLGQEALRQRRSPH